MAVNRNLIIKTLAAIEDNPDKWDQDMWVCHTGMCFAGWACALSGKNLYPEESNYRSVSRKYDISSMARNLLGVSIPEADCLFDYDNSLLDLYGLSAEVLSESREDLALAVKIYREDHKIEFIRDDRANGTVISSRTVSR